MTKRTRPTATIAKLTDLVATFGARTTNAWRKPGHRGIDFGKAAHTPYRVLRGGRVTRVQRSSAFGNVVEVRVSARVYDTYCHVLHPVKVGTRLAQADAIGQVCGHGDRAASGTVTEGFHEHLSINTTSGAYLAGAQGSNPAVTVAVQLAIARVRLAYLRALYREPSTVKRLQLARQLRAGKTTEKAIEYTLMHGDEAYELRH